MRSLVKVLPLWGFLIGLAILVPAPAAYAADSDTDSAKPGAKEDTPSADTKNQEKPDVKPGEPAKGEAGKSERPASGKEEKPEETAAPENEREKEAVAAGVELKGGLKMQELLAQGFLIRTTLLVPAEMVTRQTGKVTPDALVVTLQKETAIAVCYYTLKSYVRLRLAALSTCTMFR